MPFGVRARRAGHDHRIFRPDQQLRRLGHRAGVALRRRADHQLGNPQILFGDRFFLENRIGHQHHGLLRRSHRDGVGAHGRFGEVRKRDRRVVPLRIIANHRSGILDAVIPLRAAATVIDVQNVAKDDIERHAVGIAVVNRHGGVLQANRAVGHDHHRLAFDLGVTVGHGDRGFLMAAGEPFRAGVAAIVDEGFLKPAKAGAGIGRAILDTERLDHVHHEVGAGAPVAFDRGLGGLGGLSHRNGGPRD